MCQGLPCVGARVELIESLTTRDFRLVRGIQGVIEEEYLEAREVLVLFPQQNFRFRLPERVLRARGGNSPVGRNSPVGSNNPPNPVGA